LTDEATKASEALKSIVSDIDEDVRSIYQTGHNKVSEPTIGKLVNHSKRYLLFRIGKSHYASSVHNILEICQVPSITPLPNTPVWLKGLINLRGEIISVIDLNSFFGIDISDKTENRRLLIVRTEDNRIVTSLIIDQISGFSRLDTVYDMNIAVVFHDKVAPYLNGIFEFEGLILASLDLERFLKSSEVCQFQ
jgi:purine-binding chemotaxis protein CheW